MILNKRQTKCTSLIYKMFSATVGHLGLFVKYIIKIQTFQKSMNDSRAKRKYWDYRAIICVATPNASLRTKFSVKGNSLSVYKHSFAIWRGGYVNLAAIVPNSAIDRSMLPLAHLPSWTTHPILTAGTSWSRHWAECWSSLVL